MSNQHENQPYSATHVVVHQVPRTYGGLVIASWLLIIIACGLALVPFLGFASWIIAVPVFLATFIMAIIAMTRGGTFAGILILITSIFVGPVIVALAPIVSSALGVAGIGVAAGVADAKQRDARTKAITGQWQRDNRVLISYQADGTFDIEGQQSPVGHWSVAGDQLTLSTADTNETETITSINETELVTKDQKGKEHTHSKRAN